MDVVLSLESCPPRDRTPSVAKPQYVAEEAPSCMKRICVKILLIDLRKECRRMRVINKDGKKVEGNGCWESSDSQSSMLTLATAIEIAIASREYKIRFDSFSSCAEPWYKQKPALLCLLRSMQPDWTSNEVVVKRH